MNVETCVINCVDARVGKFFVCGPSSDTSVMPQMRRGVYEPHIQNLFCSLVKPGMIVCDIGANFGQHTILLSKLVGPDGKVYAIEASPINVEYIRHTVSVNDCINVEIIERGVWSHETELTFSHVDNAEATSFCSNKDDIRTIEPNPACKYQTISVSPLDNLVIDNIDFAKIDIEGSEMFAIRGAQKLLRLQSPILMELNSFTSKTFMGVDIIDIIDYMEDHAYIYMYMWNSYQWVHVTKNALMNLFDKGSVLIDVLFSSRQYTPTQLSSLCMREK
jgi:FkbM family methyltransferase